MALQRAISAGGAPDIHSALARIGAATGASRAYLFQVRDQIFVENTHEWCAPGIEPMQAELQQVPISVGEAFWAGFFENNLFILNDVAALAYGSELRQTLVEQGIRSLMAAPLWQDGEIRGFVGLDYVTTKHHFCAVEKALLQGFAATLDAALHSHVQRRERHRLQSDLQSAHDRIAAMVTALPELLIETDSQGLVTGFHQSQPLTFAITPEEVIGQPVEALLPTDVARLCRKAMAEARQTGWSDLFDYTLQIDGDPKRFTLHVTASGSLRSGAQHGFLFVVRDITESYLQATRIRQLGRVAELSSNLIMLTDAERRITWMNPAAIDRSGITLDSAMGKLPSEVLRYGQNDKTQVDSFCALLDQGQDILQEVRAHDSRGVPYWLNLNVQPLRDQAGATQGFMVVGNDVTVQKLAEVRALRDRQSAFEASRDGIAISQPDGLLSYLNPAFRNFLGISQTAKRLYWHDIEPQGLFPGLSSIMPALYGSGHWADEVTIRNPEGRDRFFDASMSVQDDGSFLTIVREITERKAAEKQQALLREQLQIAQSRQLVAQLAGGLAHDVANVLAVITQSLEMLRPVVGPPAAENLKRIEAAAAQAQALVGNLTRLGQRSAPRAPLDLGQIIVQAADLLRPSLPQEVELKVDLPQDPITMIGDATAVMQVILNLMLNARDALATVTDAVRERRVAVSLRLASPEDLAAPVDLGVLLDGRTYACVEVLDTGVGVAPENRQYILDPYFTTKGTQGAGLGLAIVADILRAQQAALRLQSTQDAGSVFTAFWPLDTSDPDIASDAAPYGEQPLEGMQVLIIDNDEDILIALSDILARAGAEPVSCDDPCDALEAFEEDPHSWDAVVTDHDMERMTGRELATRLHARRPDTPIIMVTGAQKLPFATNPAINAILHKPVTDTLLVAVLLKARFRHIHGTMEMIDAPSDR